MTKSIKKNKVGLIFNDLSMSDSIFLGIGNLNNFVEENQNDGCIFINKFTKPTLKIKTSVMLVHELWNFDGIAIATNLDCAKQLISATNLARNIFYVWDLEWIRNKFNYLYNYEIFNSKKLNIICRSVSHANEIQKYCGRKVSGVVSDFNIKQIIDLGAK